MCGNHGQNKHYNGVTRYNFCPTLQELSLWSRMMLYYYCMIYCNTDLFLQSLWTTIQNLPYRQLFSKVYHFKHVLTILHLYPANNIILLSLLLTVSTWAWALFNHTYNCLQIALEIISLTLSLTLQKLKWNCNVCETTNSFHWQEIKVSPAITQSSSTISFTDVTQFRWQELCFYK